MTAKPKPVQTVPENEVAPLPSPAPVTQMARAELVLPELDPVEDTIVNAATSIHTVVHDQIALRDLIWNPAIQHLPRVDEVLPGPMVFENLMYLAETVIQPILNEFEFAYVRLCWVHPSHAKLLGLREHSDHCQGMAVDMMCMNQRAERFRDNVAATLTNVPYNASLIEGDGLHVHYRAAETLAPERRNVQ